MRQLTTMRKTYGLCEAVILVLLSAAIIWFALSTNYGLLMNVKFRWLTLIGAALVLVMGLVSLAGPQKRPGLNTFIFVLMLLVVFLGKPYLPDAGSPNLTEPPLQAGLWDQIDQTRFPQKDLPALYLSEAEALYRTDASFTTVGVAKRLEVLDSHASFALMTTVMACCIADMFAVGFRVRSDDWEQIEDGQWIMVSGKLVQEQKEITLPNFRFGRAMLSSVHETYYLQPENIMSYDRVAQLPLLTDRFGTMTNRLFTRVLQESGLWQDLEGKGPFTVFVPVDQAIENLSGVSFDDLSPTALKQFASSHIVRGRFLTPDLMEQEKLETLNGGLLQVEQYNGTLRINQSRLLLKNTEARNGVIHYIYPAILPGAWGSRQ